MMTKPAVAAALIMGLALPVAAIASQSVAIVAPAGATKAHHADHRTQHAPPFDMQACLKAAEPIYASPEERKAVCLDMRAGV